MRILIPFFFLLPLQAKKPNFLFIFADDMAHEAVGALGHPEVKTPHLDRLFESGVTFTHAYNPGGWNGAICIASRTMLMSGRQLWFAEREEAEMKNTLAVEKKTWPQLLSHAGYETYMTGKWHVKMSAHDLFDHVGDVRPGMPKDVLKGYNRPLIGKPDPWDPTDKKNGGFWEGGKHWSEVEADTAIRYLDHAKGNDQPFFMYLAFNAPHDPRQSPEEFLEMYPADQVQVPENFLPTYPHRNVMEAGKNLRDEALVPMPRTEHSIQVNRREYFALITHMDAQIGRVLKHLDETGQRDHTYIVFTADHGLSVGRHGLVGKQNMYDHSIRVPFCVVGPELESGLEITNPIYLQDVVPSSLEAAGIEVPGHVQFESFIPLLKGAASGREAITTAYRMSQRQITAGGYKLILYPRGQVARLFNLTDDPLEQDDLIEKGEGIEKARELLAQLKRLQKETGDQLKLGSYPDLSIFGRGK